MFRELQIGEKTVGMVANAATPYRYKQVHGEDLLPYFSGKRTEEDQSLMIMQLAYVMTMQAEGNDFKKLNFDTYLEWLTQFDAMDLMGGKIAGEVLAIYTENTKTFSEPKKNKGRR